MNDSDPLVDALALLESGPLDPRFAARVGAIAKSELRAPAKSPIARGRPSPAPSAGRLRWALRTALVPALLSLAAVVETAATAGTVAKIYGKTPEASVK